MLRSGGPAGRGAEEQINLEAPTLMELVKAGHLHGAAAADFGIGSESFLPFHRLIPFLLSLLTLTPTSPPPHAHYPPQVSSEAEE